MVLRRGFFFGRSTVASSMVAPADIALCDVLLGSGGGGGGFVHVPTEFGSGGGGGGSVHIPPAFVKAGVAELEGAADDDTTITSSTSLGIGPSYLLRFEG